MSRPAGLPRPLHCPAELPRALLRPAWSSPRIYARPGLTRASTPCLDFPTHYYALPGLPSAQRHPAGLPRTLLRPEPRQSDLKLLDNLYIYRYTKHINTFSAIWGPKLANMSGKQLLMIYAKLFPNCVGVRNTLLKYLLLIAAFTEQCSNTRDSLFVLVQTCGQNMATYTCLFVFRQS